VTPPPYKSRTDRGVTAPPTETSANHGMTQPPNQTSTDKGVTPPPYKSRTDRGVTPPPTETSANHGVTPPPTETPTNYGVIPPPSPDLAEDASLPTHRSPEPRATRPTADTATQGPPNSAPNRPSAPTAFSHPTANPAKGRAWLAPDHAPWPSGDPGTEIEAHPNPFQDLNLRREPHSGQPVRAPSWDAPTVALAQIGRAGDLTPAQAYRAGRGRSW
jgi:hypothetical protein